MKADKQSLEIPKNISDQIQNDDFEILFIQSKELLTANRFDLAAKLIYLNFFKNGLNDGFGKELYIAHQNVMNGLVEADGSNKVGEKAFIESFQETFSSINNNDFYIKNSIPVAKDGSIVDGAHRASSCIFLKKKASIYKTNLPPQQLNYQFFIDRGLPEVYLDAMANEYIKYKDNIYLAIVWPTAGTSKNKQLEEKLHESGNIVYRKNIDLKGNGPLLLVREAYSEESWLGSYADGYQGAKNKSSWCFNQEGPVQIYLYESDKDLVLIKEEIRSVYGEGKHSIHMTDNKTETVKLANLLFNESGIHWLNHALVSDFKWFSELLDVYKRTIFKSTDFPNNYIVVGSGILGVYGLREPNDLDFVSIESTKLDIKSELISNDTGRLGNYKHTEVELILDPRNHLLLDDLKFISLRVLREYKIKRGSLNDQADFQLLNSLGSKRSYKVKYTVRIRQLTSASYWKGRIKFYLLKVRYLYIKSKIK